MAEDRILLIEDDVNCAEVIQMYLRRAGYTAPIDTAYSKRQALEMLSKGTFYHVIILDLRLQDSPRGFETFTAIRTAAPETAILVMSGSWDAQVQAALQEEGGTFLLKTEMNMPGRLRLELETALMGYHSKKGLQRTLQKLKRANGE